MNKKSVFQFKVTLMEIEPQVFRRIQVPDSYSFWDLHVAIQDAMGWKDCHLHVFHVSNPKTGQSEQIGIPNEAAFEGEPVTLPGWDVPLAGYYSKVGASARYEYDFGDDWQHEILLEDILPCVPKTKYPLCVGGSRACPPEDCGGVPGYQELLEVIRNPAHEEHENMLTWVGGNFEPDVFDPKGVRFDDPRKRWRIAIGGETK